MPSTMCPDDSDHAKDCSCEVCRYLEQVGEQTLTVSEMEAETPPVAYEARGFLVEPNLLVL